MSTRIQLNATDIETITKIVNENNIKYFTLVREEGGGIGYTVDLEFEQELNGRRATISIPVVGVENW